MGVEDFINALQKAKSMDGKVIGEDSEFIRSELAENDKQAWIKHLAVQYFKHEDMDTPPPELGIVKEDVVKEICRREIKKIFGKG